MGFIRTFGKKQYKYLIKKFPKEKTLYPPENAVIEGGDIVLFNEYVFVGQIDRTNKIGYEFLKHHFSNKKVIPLEVTVTDSPMTNVLHLDCAFQPVGERYAIIYEQGFVKRPDIIYGEKNLIKFQYLTPIAISNIVQETVFFNIFILQKEFEKFKKMNNASLGVTQYFNSTDVKNFKFSKEQLISLLQKASKQKVNFVKTGIFDFIGNNWQIIDSKYFIK